MFMYNKNYQGRLDENLEKRYANAYEFSKHDIDKFLFIVTKRCLPLWINGWLEKNQWKITTRQKKIYVERVSKEFEIKNLGEYHDFSVQSDTLLLADIFNSIRNTCLKIYGSDPAHFYCAQGFAWQATLKKIKVKLDILTVINMLLMAEKGITRGIHHAINRYVKTNNKYMKVYDKS